MATSDPDLIADEHVPAALDDSDAVSTLVLGLVDDAGLFPPEALDMASALGRHRADQAAASPALTHRFVCPVTRFDELQDHLEADDHLQVIALAPAVGGTAPGLASIAREGRLRVVALETTLPLAKDRKRLALQVLDRLADRHPDIEVYVESPFWPSLESDMDLLVQHGHLAKVRCGGVRPELFPTPADLARFIGAAVERGLPFKATAGLHRAVAHRDDRTGFEHFGFLNLLAAVSQALGGTTASDLEAVLLERDAGVLLEQIAGLTEGADGKVRGTFRSFGSCSTSEPLDDLAELGVITRSAPPRTITSRTKKKPKRTP